MDVPQMNVLLVEDNPGDARLIRAMLDELSHEPVHLVRVERLAAGLDYLRHSNVDVVLLDLGLPDSQGLETFVQVRDTVPRLPIVVLSGHTDTSLALHAVRQGAQDYLLKGHVDAELLMRALRHAVEHKRILEHQRYLSDASRALAGSLDYQATMERVARLPVPLMAEACVLELRDEDRSEPWLVVHAVDPACAERLREASESARAARTCLEPEVGVPPAFARLGFAACLVVPLSADGRVLGSLSLLRNAERSGFSAEEAEMLDELALRSALALDNARLHRELQVAIRLRDEVLASTSHDLRSPLSGIKLQGVRLRRQLLADPAAVDAELHERVALGLDEIDATITRSLGLLQELLDAASLQAGRQLQLDLRPTDLVALARRVVGEHQARTGYHQLRVEASDQALVGEWDVTRLGRVVDNLLSNAVKYSPRPDTITVALAREVGAIHDWAALRVQDHGVGIPPGELRYVFDRFYRGSNVPREIRGVGIGLSGVRQIVEQHGGHISVDSQEGVGSTFTVRLPLHSA
jgi:signal transduction histidine kinase/DNA-binding NarL/FixJ family response regulator